MFWNKRSYKDRVQISGINVLEMRTLDSERQHKGTFSGDGDDLHPNYDGGPQILSVC